MKTPVPAGIDTVVIGGGIVGSCLTWFLAAAGVAVLCLDAGHFNGSGTNAGSLHVQMQSRFMRLYPHLVAPVERSLPLYIRAVAEWQRISAELDDDIELALTGGLMVAETTEQLTFLAAKCRREEQLGLPVRMLDRPMLDRFAPYLGRSVLGAELCEIEGKLNPLLANLAIRRRLSDAGATLLEKVPVTGLAQEKSGFRLATPRGVISARRVVIAAGAGSGALAQALSVLLPTKAEPLHMNITERTAKTVSHLVQHAERSITLKQLHAGHVVIGGGWPAQFDKCAFPTVMLSSLIGNVSLAQHIVPALASLRILRTWAGINTTVDGRCVLGEVPRVRGLFFAVPGDAGYSLGPFCARLVANVMLGRAPPLPLDDYAPTRFG